MSTGTGSSRDVLAAHPFADGLPGAALDDLASYARSATFEDGAYLFHEGEDADALLLVTDGLVSVEIHVPGRGPIVVDTVRERELLGWSWFLKPHRWQFDARAVGAVSALALDAARLRAACDADASFGYAIAARLAGVMQHRLRSARVRLLDLYRGDSGA